MADEEEKKEEEKGAAKKGSGMKTILIGLVAGLAIGGGVAFFMKGNAAPPQVQGAEASDGKEASDAVEAEKEVAAEAPLEDEGGIYDLDPFIVNLADRTKVRYLKVTIKLDMIKEEYSEDLSKRLPQIRDTLLLLLSSKEFATIRTVEGKMELRDEILQRVNSIFKNNRIKMAYFTDFVTQ